MGGYGSQHQQYFHDGGVLVGAAAVWVAECQGDAAAEAWIAKRAGSMMAGDIARAIIARYGEKTRRFRADSDDGDAWRGIGIGKSLPAVAV